MLFISNYGTLRWQEMGPHTGCLLPLASFPLPPTLTQTQKYNNHKASLMLRRPDKKVEQTPVLPNHWTPLTHEDRLQEAQDLRVTQDRHKWPSAGEGQRNQPCLQDVVYRESALVGRSMFIVKFNLEKFTFLHVWAQEFKMLTFYLVIHCNVGVG